MTEASVTELSDFRDNRRGPSTRGRAQAAWALPETLTVPPPTGTVTFLLTDIEGSTPRWEAAPDAMTWAVRRHYEILDAAVTAHGGVRPVEQGEGDSMVAAFSRATDAVAAALAAQRALLAEPWPAGADLSVRVAVHTGEALLRDGLYYVGPSIIRCARLRSLGHGRQVLMSAVTADLLVDGLPPGAALLPLGTHRLKGLRHAERVFQLAHPDLPARFPALRSLDPIPATLPVQATSFVGRTAELAEIGELLASALGAREHRVVTLAGAGGTGKTRLAAQAAGYLVEPVPDGVWWVELAPVGDPGQVPRAVMDALGLDDARGLDPVARLREFLADRRALLVLDNCEHVVEAVADLLTAVLGACRQVSVLATSREPLRVAGEVVWRVPPMVLATDSVELFAQRAAEARPGFRVDADNADVVAALCDRLDGLPLAIELAAARVRGLPPRRILDGLTQRFALLTGGARSTVPHQQTLAASMAWSHDLLTEPQQILFRRLSVFTGAFTLDAVEEVASADPLTPWECLVLLTELVDRSLVVFDGEHYRLLQTVCEYAGAELEKAGEDAGTRAAHVTCYAGRAAYGAAQLNASPQIATLEDLETARANIVSAIEHAVSAGNHAAALSMAADMAIFWQMHGRYAESLACLRRVLAGTPDEPTPERARVLWAAGQLGLWSMDLPGGYGIAETARAVEIAEVAGDDRVLGRALCMRHVVDVFTRPERAVAGLRTAREVAVRAGDRFAVNTATVYLSLAGTFGLDDADLAAPELARLQAEAAATGSPYWALWHTICSCFAAFRTGRLAAAVELGVAAVEQARTFGDPQLECYCAIPLADAYVDLGQADAAAEVVARSVGWQDRSAIGRAEFIGLRQARNLLVQGDLSALDAQLTRLEPTLRALGFDFLLTELVGIRGRAALANGEVPAARAAVEETKAYADALAMPWYTAWVTGLDGRVARVEGRPATATDNQLAALTLCVRHGYDARAAEALDCLASLAADAQSWAEAGRLLGAARALRERTGHRRPRLDAAAADADATAVATALGAEAYGAALEEGGRLAPAQALAYAVEALGCRKRPASGWDALTPAEAEVVALAAQGWTNAQIGAELNISAVTVKTHLRRIFAKLGLTRRAELAARATERRLTAEAAADA